MAGDKMGRAAHFVRSCVLEHGGVRAALPPAQAKEAFYELEEKYEDELEAFKADKEAKEAKGAAA
jgi:hypothetical protein